MRRSFRDIFALIILAGVIGCTAAPRPSAYELAPSLLPHTTRAMKTPGFWVSRHPVPDLVYMEPEEIVQFNQAVRGSELTKDIMATPSLFSGRVLKEELEKNITAIREKRYFDNAGKVAPEKFFEAIRQKMALTEIPDQINTRYGFIVRFSDQRFFPTEEGLYGKPGDVDFDELQNSDLDPGTPAVVLHASQDGEWYYVLTDISDGWVQAENVALGDFEEMNAYFMAPSWAVVVSAKADIFWDAEKTQHYDYVRMGSRFPIEETGEETVKIRFPGRDAGGQWEWKTGFMNKKDIHEGYLAYTPRNVINQAFALLNEPYGWGGLHGEQDCSRFLHEIFSTFGIILPRNSKEQARAGKILGRFTEDSPPPVKLKTLEEQAVGGITVLGMKGHIMLYLGWVEGRPYAIHATWGYRVPAGDEDRVCVVNRVVVSDLSLGEGSQRGSLLERIHSIVLMAK